MSKIFILLAMVCLTGQVELAYGSESESKEQNGEKEMTPKYLYKVLSVEDWKKSQGMESVKLTAADRDFIHLSRKDQLDRIIEKYWDNVPEFVILKVDAAQLLGKLRFEANPGGINKYYHLYNGSIPLEAVIESKRITR